MMTRMDIGETTDEIGEIVEEDTQLSSDLEDVDLEGHQSIYES